MSKWDSKQQNQKEIYPNSPGYIHPEFPLSIKEFQYSEIISLNLMTLLREHIFWIRVMDGEVCFVIDGKCVSVSASETLFINSRHFNRFCSVKTPPARFRVVAAMADAVKVPVLANKISRMTSDDSFPYTIIRPSSELFSFDLDAIFDLCDNKPEDYEFSVASHFLCMLRQIYRVYHHTNPNETITQNYDLQQLRDMLGFIDENYSEEITVDQIALAGKISRSRCTRLFRRYLQESPIEHVQKYRLEKCVYLINNTDLPFSEIASKCGFNQQSYFNRLFHRQYGITPKQMRANTMKKLGKANMLALQKDTCDYLES